MVHIAMAAGLLLILIGLWGILTRKNIILIIVGFSLFDTGLHIVMLSIGYLRGRTAPIFDTTLSTDNAFLKIVDPIPQALVLTAIVIGLGITALMLAYAIKLFENRQSLEIDKYEDLKW
jgi:multicomponent Na+:H+ antiporter subunit C